MSFWKTDRKDLTDRLVRAVGLVRHTFNCETQTRHIPRIHPLDREKTPNKDGAMGSARPPCASVSSEASVPQAQGAYHARCRSGVKGANWFRLARHA